MKQDELDIRDRDVVWIFGLIGVICVAYEYAPFYGATPLAIALYTAVAHWVVYRRRLS